MGSRPLAVRARGSVYGPLLEASSGAGDDIAPSREQAQPATPPGDPSDGVTVVSFVEASERRPQRHLPHRTRSAMQALLLEAPLTGLLDFVIEKDALVRRSLVREWVGMQALQGKLPGFFSRELDSEAWIDWVEDNFELLLKSLFEELDVLRRYRQTENKEIVAALGHINRTMGAHWRYCHH
jgi:hypothetical protein